jgi:hypothetical protein
MPTPSSRAPVDLPNTCTSTDLGRRRARTLRPCLRLVAVCAIRGCAGPPHERSCPSHHARRVCIASRSQKGVRPGATRPADGYRASAQDPAVGKASRRLPVGTRRPYWRLGFSGYCPADCPAKCGLGDRGRSSAHPNRTPRPLGERCCRRSSGRRDNGTTTEAADRLRTTITLCFRHRSAEHRPADESQKLAE